MGFQKVVAILIAVCSSLPAMGSPQEPGPENGGLKFGLKVRKAEQTVSDGFDVTVRLHNATNHPVTLRADWRNDDAGDVSSYIEAATSIECYPAVAPWRGGVMEQRRETPQPEYVLAAGGVLTIEWTTDGNRLKNRVTNPNNVQNPRFPFAGLYSVHAIVDMITTEGTVRLRSNEQLVEIAGSRKMPRHTVGQLWSVDSKRKTAQMSLGRLQQVGVGDQFEIGHPKSQHWKFTVTRVELDYCVGTIETLTRRHESRHDHLPDRLMETRLILED